MKAIGFHTMRRSLVLASAVAVALQCGNAFAADMPVPRLAKPKDIPVQVNQPNCSRWTDECVSCTRGADGAAPTCSNIGFACQPKTIRCLSEMPQGEPQKK